MIELVGSKRYGEPVGSITVNSLVRWQIINHSFKNHTLCSYSRLNTQFRSVSISNVNVKHLLAFCPLRSIKLSLRCVFADAVSFLLFCAIMDNHGATHPALDWKLQPIKSHKFYGTRSGHGKVKKGNFWLPRIRKECAPEFNMLADYIIRVINQFDRFLELWV